MTPTKSCLQCGQTLHGRFDKKFCDDQCRSNFNNLLNSDVSSTMRNINYILRKNRRILAALLPCGGKTKIKKDKLNAVGFDFRYFTHYYQNQKGRTFNVCYDYCYLLLESNQVQLMSCNERRPHKLRNKGNLLLKQQDNSILFNGLNEPEQPLTRSA